MKSFVKTIDSISDWSGKIFSFLVVAATGVVVYGVIMRYAFNSPLICGLELSIYLCAATYLMGRAYAHLSTSHVRIDLLYRRWSPRLRAIVDLVSAPVFFTSVGAMGWIGVRWTVEALERGVTSGSAWSPVIWPVRLLIALGAILLLLQGIAKFIRDVGTARSADPQ